MQDNRKGNVWVWIGVVVVIIIAVVLLVGWRPGSPTTQPGSTQTGSANSNGISYASQGQVVSGFPQSLIMDPSATVATSYTINASGTTQYTATWNSSSSANTIFDEYFSYFQANQWTISNQQSQANFLGMAAGDGNGHDVDIVVEPQGSGSTITVSYTESSQ